MQHPLPIAHLLYQGELSDAPGRNESWTEWVTYRGNGRWALVIDGTDSAGVTAAPPVRERFSTRGIVQWATDRDAEEAQPGTPAEAEDDSRPLGARASRLRDIAVEVGADHCVTLLDRYTAGTWPAPKRIRILAVNGKTHRTVWRGVHHPCFDVDTDRGTAYLYPPDDQGVGNVVLKTAPASDRGTPTKLSRAIARRVRELLEPREVTMDELLDALHKEMRESVPHQFGKKPSGAA